MITAPYGVRDHDTPRDAQSLEADLEGDVASDRLTNSDAFSTTRAAAAVLILSLARPRAHSSPHLALSI